MTKHTPGPWYAYKGERNIWHILDNPSPMYSRSICSTQGADFTEETNEANARLLAAAPELLQATEHQYSAMLRLMGTLVLVLRGVAVRDVEQVMDEARSAAQEARDAIAKEGGR